MTLLETAREFATRAHAGQFRKGAAREPYVTHVTEVAALVTAANGSETAIAAAWLHDTVEDCGVAPETLTEAFGLQVAKVVLELTDDKTLPKPRRKRMQIVNAPGKSPDAALVKICDKLSNVRALRLSPPVSWNRTRRLAYLDWAEAVVAALPEAAAPLRSAFARELGQARETLS